MGVTADDLRGPWRRLDEAMERLRAGSNLSSESPLVGDALVHALDELYRLSEAWKKDDAGPRSNAGQNAAAAGDDEGMTVVALLLARGESTHHLIRVDQGHGFGVQPFGASPFGGGWYFQKYSGWHWIDPEKGPKTWEEQRADWYGRHVADGPVVERLEAAYRWLRRVVPPPPTE